MGGVASRLQGGDGARRGEESEEEVELRFLCVQKMQKSIHLMPFQLGNPLGRGTKRRREVEDDIKVIAFSNDSYYN